MEKSSYVKPVPGAKKVGAHYSTANKLAKNQKSHNTKCWQGCRETKKLINVKTSTVTLEGSFIGLIERKISWNPGPRLPVHGYTRPGGILTLNVYHLPDEGGKVLVALGVQ